MLPWPNRQFRHSKTSEVHVSVTIETGGFTLCVEDKGCGFDPRESERRTAEPYRPGPGGLANMRQRLAEIGGRCQIQSEPGKGTTVEFVVPVKVIMT